MSEPAQNIWSTQQETDHRTRNKSGTGPVPGTPIERPGKLEPGRTMRTEPKDGSGASPRSPGPYICPMSIIAISLFSFYSFSLFLLCSCLFIAPLPGRLDCRPSVTEAVRFSSCAGQLLPAHHSPHHGMNSRPNGEK